MLELLVGIWVGLGILFGVLGFLVLWIAFSGDDE